MENIRFGKLGASDEEVYAAAREANAHEFITSFPEGYHTVVGECQGQRPAWVCRAHGVRLRPALRLGRAGQNCDLWGQGSPGTSSPQRQTHNRDCSYRPGCVMMSRSVRGHVQGGVHRAAEGVVGCTI